jgi:Arc/MetJ-type ribon-helix-helix transcriptional regulator
MTVEDLNRPEDLAGLKVVITGRLSNHSRAEARELVSDIGATVTKSISQQTDLLIVGENPGDEKHGFALENDITRLSGEDFYNLFESTYEVDAIVACIVESIVEDNPEYTSMSEAVNEAVREFLKKIIDGEEVEFETNSGATTELSISLDEELSELIEASLSMPNNRYQSVNEFVIAALRSEFEISRSATREFELTVSAETATAIEELVQNPREVVEQAVQRKALEKSNRQ